MAVATGTYGIGYKANGVAYASGDSVTIDGSPVTLDGGYLTVGAYFADIAATLTGNLTGYIGYSANDGTTKIFTEAGFVFPNINISGFRCRLLGGLGSISTLDQVVLDSNGTSNGLHLVNLTSFGLELENFEVKNTPSQNTIVAANNANPLFKEVYAHGGYSGIINTRGTHRFVSCIFSGGYAIGHLSGNASYCENCLLIGTTSYVLQGNRPLGHFKGCTFDGVNYVDNAIGTNAYENCILLAGTHCFNTGVISTAAMAQIYLPWSNNIFYSTANPTEVFAGQDLPTYLTQKFWLTMQNQYNKIADPLFVGTGNLLNQYSLQSGSPAKASNKTLIAQALYPSQKRFRITSGIWQDDVAVTYAATTDVRNNVDRGDGSLGTLLVPAPTDVRFGVGTDNTTGSAYIPGATDVRFGTNVDATTGLAYIPSAIDVRFGTNVDATTGSAYIPVAADVRFGTNVDATTGLAYIPIAADVRNGTNVDGTIGTADIPNPNDVQTGVPVDATIGNFDSPAITDVRTTIGYGSGGTEFTGSASIPSVSDVRTGISVDAGIGTADIPLASDVRTGVNVDAGIGTAAIPSPNDVQTGVSVDATIGNFDAPATTDVRTAIGYGSNGTEFTGNVDLPIVGDVRLAITYGANGTEYTGALVASGSASTDPTALTIINSGDNITWLVTVGGAAIGAAINIYNQADDTLITTVDASALTADLTAGQVVYIKALESNRVESGRFPAASGVTVPILGASPAGSGLLSFNNLYSSGTIDLYYAAGSNFSTGTLYKTNKDTGIVTTQTVSSTGSITATGITLGVWDFYIIPENSAGILGTHSNVVTIKYDGLGSFGNNYFELMWRKDLSATWHTKQFNTLSKQVSHNINISGKSIQLRVKNNVPDQYIEIRNVNLHARMRGRSMNTVRS